MKSFVDSNVLVYLFDQDSPEKKAAAQRIIQTEGAAGNLLLSTQVLQEFYVTVTRKLATPLKPLAAADAVSRFASFSVIAVGVALILAAIHRSQVDPLSFWDCLITVEGKDVPHTRRRLRIVFDASREKRGTGS